MHIRIIKCSIIPKMRRVFLNKTKKSEDSDDKFRVENTLSLEGYQDWGGGERRRGGLEASIKGGIFACFRLCM